MATTTTKAKTEGTPTFSTRNDIPADNRAKLISILNQQLADTFDLMSQTKFCALECEGTELRPRCTSSSTSWPRSSRARR